MMNLRDFAGERYIKIDDVRERPLRVSIAEIREGKYGRPELVAKTNEVLSLNQTNVGVLLREFGEREADCIGKQVELALGQVMYEKKLQDSVIVRPITPPSAAAEKPVEKLDEEIPF